MLTKTDIKILQSLGYCKRQILFIDKYIKSQKEREHMPKKISLLEVLGVEKYNEYLVALCKKGPSRGS